jgi:hypothetical protein
MENILRQAHSRSEELQLRVRREEKKREREKRRKKGKRDSNKTDTEKERYERTNGRLITNDDVIFFLRSSNSKSFSS